MLDLLIKFVFTVISTVANIIITPFITAITNLFPSVNTYFTYIFTYIDSFIQFIPVITGICLIPTRAIELLFAYLSIKYSIYILKISINFVLKVYNLLKP